MNAKWQKTRDGDRRPNEATLRFMRFFTTASAVFSFAMVALVSVPENLFAAPLPPAGSSTASSLPVSQLPKKLPPKKRGTSKPVAVPDPTSAHAKVVEVAPKAVSSKKTQALSPSVKMALEEAKSDLDEVLIRVRPAVPAPPGDLSEPLSEATLPAPPIDAATSVSKILAPAPTIAAPSQKELATPKVSLSPRDSTPNAKTTEQPPSHAQAPLQSQLIPEIVGPPLPRIDTSGPRDRNESGIASSEGTTSKAKVESVAVQDSTSGGDNAITAFFRTGYLKSHSSAFDSRMKDGATSMGMGVGRGFQSGFGLFEARASIDVYHAIDQSVGIDTIRMISTRTEAAYWFSGGKVRPGLTIALGWTEYSIRSYHHREDAPVDEIQVRTHAQSQAFTVIPGTSIRIEINDGLSIDFQTEYIALLGGASSQNVQGLGATLGLGWKL